MSDENTIDEAAMPPVALFGVLYGIILKFTTD